MDLLPCTVLCDDRHLCRVPRLHVFQGTDHRQQVIHSYLALTQQNYIQQEPSCELQNMWFSFSVTTSLTTYSKELHHFQRTNLCVQSLYLIHFWNSCHIYYLLPGVGSVSANWWRDSAASSKSLWRKNTNFNNIFTTSGIQMYLTQTLD